MNGKAVWMNKRLTRVFSLIGFLLMWGLFSFVESVPESELTLLGLGAVILILLWLHAARKPVTSAEREEPSDES
jgi:hypothetical protein